jgi:hypothetical protein
MSIITVGIDLAKNVFAVHGVDDNGKSTLVKPKVSREQLLPLIAQLPPCLIGMEACSGAHHWARQFRQYGHTIRLMAPKFVTPYRMGGKRGKNDAARCCASANCPSRFTGRARGRVDTRASPYPCRMAHGAAFCGSIALPPNIHAPSRPMACKVQSTVASAAPMVSKMRAISPGSTISGGDSAMMSPV